MRREIVGILSALVLVVSLSLVTAVPALAAPEVTFRSAGSSPGADSTSCVITKPAGLAIGDLMIAQVVGADPYFGANLGAFTAPAGWTSIRQDVYPDVPCLASALFWKIADASDVAAASFTFTATGATSNRGTITAWYGHDPTAPINDDNGRGNTYSPPSTTVSSPGITPTVADCTILLFCSIFNGDNNTQSGYAIANNNPSPWIEAYDLPSNLSQDLGLSMGYATRPETTFTGDGTATTSEPDGNTGQLVAIAPNLNYDLTTSSTAGGSVTTPGEGTFTYDEGTVVDLVATPGVGYRFDKWTGDVGTVDDVYAATTTITMNGDYSITAEFVRQYDLTTSSTAGGSVTTPGEGLFTYDEGEIVDLVATPDAGYRFDEWTGDVGTIDNVYAASTTITMNGDYSITAEFVRQYDLSTSSTAGGSVTTPGEGLFTYDEGTVVDLVAEADTCYEFVNWTGDVGTIADVYADTTTITMNGDYSITANFEPIYPTVTTQAATGIGVYSTTLNMNYTTGNFSSVQVRFAYKKSDGLFWSHTEWILKSGDDTHAEQLTGLTTNTQYDFKAQLNYDDTVIEGTILQFTTDRLYIPPPSGGPAAIPCFIATAAYGTPMAEEIQILRDFRDEYLLTNPVGQTLVDFYYRNSPPIAKFITEHPSLKPIVRAGLLPVVAMSTIAVNATLAENIAIIGLLALVAVAVTTWATRRQGRGPQYT